jgi:hypothetical protein
VTGGPPDPWHTPDAPEDQPGDLLEGGTGPSRWRRRWTALSPLARRLVVVGVVLLVAGVGVVEFREWAAERARTRVVDLATSVDVFTSSTTPPGGQVTFLLVVRNDGPLPVVVTSVAGSAAGLRLRGLDDVERRLPPNASAAVPLSVRLDCRSYLEGDGLTAEVSVRRQDGGSAARRVRPDPADLLLDVATTLCRAQPGLRDREISGPVLDPD